MTIILQDTKHLLMINKQFLFFVVLKAFVLLTLHFAQFNLGCQILMKFYIYVNTHFFFIQRNEVGTDILNS